MYTYLLNLTFYAGSDAPEDTDRDLFIMKTSETYSEEQMEDVFQKVNSLLGSYTISFLNGRQNPISCSNAFDSISR